MAWGSFLMRNRIAVILALTVGIATAIVPGFASLTTLSLAVDRGAAMGIVAVGLTVLLIAGKIDLSVGSVFAVSGIVAIQLQPALGLWPAAIVGVLAGMLCGAINGFVTVQLKVNALVATLATMLMFRAVAHWLTDSQPLAGGHIMFSIELSRIYLDLFTARSALFLLLVLALHVWLSRTVGGRNLYAVGSNSEAAEASGLPVDRIVFLGFIFAGGMAGLAGVLQALATNTGSPVFGAEMTVAVIAAVVVGGTRIEGGRGSALGTLGGVLTIAALTTAMEFQSVPAYFQRIVAGLILILIVVLDRNVAAPPRGSPQAHPAE
ncbi:ABC transporter permease [Roseibacterium sp. SDUM158017]|uniref:ABC transporter permease n=1 Tax=Roseicyclus salinarum TaxID=3036773 RepID=UPI00241547E3|nr:ABC transporter permease [Roseibacterium sp. SDUM158017]MDG4648683.1 ABC transporter permease [Roseibacterium sp. SDUM158017]